jgi:tetratricopeptide (TPR) repeat protein
MKFRHIIYTFAISLIATFSIHAQSLDEARTLFNERKFSEALPMLQQGYAVTPENPQLNQMLGVSLYETGRIREAEKHLLFASQRRVTDAHLYLGAIYSLMYRFADAEREFGLFERANRRNNVALEQLAEKRAYVAKLHRAVQRTEDIQIIDSLIVPKNSFLTAYNLSASSGSLMPMNDFFRNTVSGDKVLFMSGRGDRVHFSNGDELNGFSLFTMERLLDTFGNERKLPENINSSGSNAYPFVMTDGLTLYFASTGHNSLGGYDLFVTRYNLNTDSYLNPSQMNPPFNSPFNDYMLVIDEEKGVGWFASDRFQDEGNVIVYTFIPNPQVRLLEVDDEKELARRAMITSIRDSWRDGVDSTTLIQRARQRVVAQQENQGDFEFIINDNITYHTLSDFRNAQARAQFSQALMLESQLNTLSGQLSELRDQFPNNQSLRHTILDLERQTESLHRQVESLKVEARNTEIRNL